MGGGGVGLPKRQCEKNLPTQQNRESSHKNITQDYLTVFLSQKASTCQTMPRHNVSVLETSKSRCTVPEFWHVPENLHPCNINIRALQVFDPVSKPATVSLDKLIHPELHQHHNKN